MTRKMIIVCALGALVAEPLPAASDILTDIESCKSETDEARRLACYDRLGDGVATPPASEQAAPGPVIPTPEEKFGSADLRAQQQREAELADTERLEVLVAKVTAVSRQPNGAHIVTLDNGQVWRETTIEHFFRVSVGEEVRIKAASLGSFLLANKYGRSTRVRRTQ